MVTYAIFKDEKDEKVVTIISLTKLVNEVMDKKDFDYVTAIIEVASLVDANYIVSDASDDNIMLMFPNAQIVEYKEGEIN